MDYIIAGLTAAALFVYLVYALLLPERF
jgi:K+-transporting ATPase, KdpF subunit